MILLDTHALIWLADGSGKLGKRSAAIAREAWDQGRLAVSAVSFWEITMLHAKKRVTLGASPTEMRNMLLVTDVIEIAVDGEIAMLAASLESLHKDPADRFIAATAIVKGAALVTADAKLLSWDHPLKRHDAGK